MKKRSVLSILCLLLLFSGGCGSLSHYKQVSVEAVFTKEQLVLNLPNRSTAQPGYFQLENLLDHETLQSALPEGAQSSQLENGWLISTENDNGTKNQFYLYTLPNPEALDWNGYGITQTAVVLETPDLFDLGVLLFPVQYLVNMETHLFPDMDYEIDAALDELTEFYQDSGWYDFEANESSLVFSGYRQQPNMRSQEYYIAAIDDFPLTIHYREEDDKRFIKIEYSGRELTREEKYPEGKPKPTQKPAETFWEEQTEGGSEPPSSAA